MDYRSAACATCGLPGTGTCSRCTTPVCDEHGGAPWCRACESEHQDELELATAEATLQGSGVIEDREGRASGLTFFVMLANLIDRPFRVRRARAAARRQFAAREPAEVLAARVRRTR